MNDSAQGRVPARKQVFHGALFLLLWMTFCQLPQKAVDDATPDLSWHGALNYFATLRLQSGRDVLFTYGPLGFLEAKSYSGYHFIPLVTWALVSKALYAAAIVCVGVTVGNLWLAGVFYALAFLFLNVQDEASTLFVIVAVTSRLCHAEKDLSVQALVLVLLLAWFSTIKFTFLLLAGVAVVLVTSGEVLRRRYGAAVLVAAGYTLFVMVLWAGCGQSLANYPAYLASSLDIAAGYAEAMASEEPPGALAIGLGLWLMILLNLAFARNREGTNARQSFWPEQLACLAGFFLAWKHSFVRADSYHLPTFFVFCLAMAFLPCLRSARGAQAQSLRRLSLLGMALFSVSGLLYVGERGVMAYVRTATHGLRNNPSQLLHLPGLKNRLETRWAGKRAKLNLPECRHTVHDASIDQYGIEQAAVLANGFNYRPRPAFEGFFVSTPRLMHANQSYYRSDSAPEFVLLRFAALDHTLPGLADSLALKELFLGYHPVLSEKVYLLLQRNEEGHGARQPDVEFYRDSFPFGEPVELTYLHSDLVWAQLDIQPTWLGRLVSVLYKPPALTMDLWINQSAVPCTYRVSPLMAREGFVLNPFLQTSQDIVSVYTGTTKRCVSRVRVSVPKGKERLLHKTYTVSLSRVPRPCTPPIPPEMAGRLAFPMMGSPPVSVDYGIPPEPRLAEDGVGYLLVIGEGNMTFDIRPGARVAEAVYAVEPEAYLGPIRTDGVEFIVDWVDPKGVATRLFRRLLDPVAMASDRKPQPLSLALPENCVGQLVLRTRAGPAGDTTHDWSLWTLVSIR